MLSEIIEQCKYENEEKIAISLRLPKSIKEKLNKISTENNISSNNLIISIIGKVLNEKEKEI